MAGGRGGGRGGSMPREVQVSKKLSWLLRHGVEKEGLQLGEGGYISVKDVLNNRNIKSLKATFDEIKEIVAENDKQRFSLIHKSALPSLKAVSKDTTTENESTPPTPSDPPQVVQADASNDPADYLIRANQGHSLKVESDGLLNPITADNMPTTVVHGTTHSAWRLIVASGGLKKMGRTHVHFASGLPAGFKMMTAATSNNEEDGESSKVQPPVISGMRNSSSVLVFVDIKKAMDAGLEFWISENGVILSEGDENGIIGLRFFSRAEDRTGGVGVLVQDGVVVNEAPESWAKGGAKRGGKKGGKQGGQDGGKSGAQGAGKPGIEGGSKEADS